MDVTGSGTYTCQDSEYISRPDVWRLLHLPPREDDGLGYEYRPSMPWKPCGRSLIKDCALRVTSLKIALDMIINILIGIGNWRMA